MLLLARRLKCSFCTGMLEHAERERDDHYTTQSQAQRAVLCMGNPVTERISFSETEGLRDLFEAVGQQYTRHPKS